MKKYLFTLPVFLLFVQFVKAQCPTAPITFANQSQINTFPSLYPGCTIIADSIDIKIMGNDISDLGPLSQLTLALGVLEIRNCPLLTSLNGLNNITAIGNDPLDGFILRDLPALNTLAALNALDSIHGEFTIRTCNALTTLAGLSGLKKENGSLIIRDNATLQNLNGLDSLNYIGETLELVQNPLLNSVAALGNVNTIVGGIEGGVFIENNSTLNNLTGLGNGNTNIGSNLDITLNGNLNLCAVPSICKYLANPPVGATITITANKVDCNTESEIFAKCALAVTEKNAVKHNISIFPNPVSDHFKIITSEVEFNTELYDVYGKKIGDLIPNKNLEYNLINYPQGSYLLKITNLNGQQKISRIIKL